MFRSRLRLFGLITVAIFVVLVILVPSIFGYWWHGVGSNEIGVTTYKNQVTGVLGPGVWSDWRYFADIEDVSTEGLDFCVEDPEVLIKKAEQRIGVRVCGRIRRPGVEHNYAVDWAQYRSLYLNDSNVVGERDAASNLTNGGVVFAIGSQAMKVCVGDRNFEESVVGSARDDLRECIDKEMSSLAESYGGLIVDNVTVPNVALSPAAQGKMDEITQSRLEAELARKNADKAAAEGERQLAVEQAAIKVAQGKLQEEQRQKAVTADLERQALEAQKAVIEAEKTNQLAGAQRDLDIQIARKLAAEQQALAQMAKLEAEASIYTRHPRFAAMRVATDYAKAYTGGEKMIVPGNTDIRVLLGGSAVTPFISLNGEPAPN